MKVGRAVIAFGALCVLLIVASGAQSASATGTTAYTCKKGAKGGTTFSTPHCRSTDAAGKYGHVTLANNTTTELSGNNKDHEGKAAPALLVATVFGTTIELQGKALAATGTMENKEEGGEMFASGEGTITFTEVSVVKPANCQVQTDVLPSKEKGEVGVIHTEALKATTKGQGDRVKFEPKEGTTFARFWMTGESCGAKNTTFTVTGSITGVPNGATVELSEADTTAQNTLKLLGAKAGLTGSLTIEGKDPTVEGDAFRPLAATTGEEGESEAENTENEEAEEAETEEAETNGTTAYTCKEGVGVGATFNTSHCRPADASGKYGHFSITNNTTTEVSGDNKDHEGKAQNATLVGVVSGVSLEVKGEAVEVTGTITNGEEGGEMWTSGDGVLTFREISVVKPANCEVRTDIHPAKEQGEKNVIHTEALKATTKGQGDQVKVEPNEGTTFARFWLVGGSCTLAGETFSVTGSVEGTPNGSTLSFTEAETTTQDTLKINGNKAGFSGSLALKGRDPIVEGDSYKRLSVTTGKAGESEEEQTEREEEEAKTAEEAETEEAETIGTTAYTCKEGVGVGATFNTSHCRPADASGKYGHFSITNDTTTKVLGDNKDHEGKAQNATLVGVVSGVSLEVKGEAVEVEGSVTNSEEGGEMWASGEGILTFREISVLKPANCQAQTDVLPSKEKGEVGVIHTEPMRATTKGQGDQVKVEPKEGTTFARFWLVGGSCTLAGETFSVTGSVEGTPNGSTLNFTEAETTTQDTLKINGNKAGFSGSLALKGKHPSIEGETYKRLSVTTK